MSAQPEALRLAESLANADRTLVMHERASDVVFYRPRDKGSDIDLAAAELRRLHALNAELLEALRKLLAMADSHNIGGASRAQARAAIQKATGGQS